MFIFGKLGFMMGIGVEKNACWIWLVCDAWKCP